MDSNWNDQHHASSESDSDSEPPRLRRLLDDEPWRLRYVPSQINSVMMGRESHQGQFLSLIAEGDGKCCSIYLEGGYLAYNNIYTS